MRPYTIPYRCLTIKTWYSVGESNPSLPTWKAGVLTDRRTEHFYTLRNHLCELFTGCDPALHTVITARQSAAFPDHPRKEGEPISWLTVDVYPPIHPASVNATNGSGNLFVYFKDLMQPVSIYFVALLTINCSINSICGLLQKTKPSNLEGLCR